MAQLAPLELTFAGIPFVLNEARVVRAAGPKPHEIEAADQLPPRKYQPLADLCEELDRLLPFKYLSDFSYPDAYSDHQDSLARRWRGAKWPNPSIRLGEWFYPSTASRWSVFRGLATSSQVKFMLKATGGYRSDTFVMQAEPLGPGFISPHTDPVVRLLTGVIEEPYRLRTEMFMLPPRPLAEHGGQFDGLYLVTLVDERYYWQYRSVTLKITKNTLWNDVINQCQRALFLPVQNIDLPDARYGLGPEVDSPFWSDNGNAAVFMDAAAFNVGDTVIRLLRAAAGGQFKFLHALESQTVAKDNRGNATKLSRTAGGELFVSGITKLPVGPTETTRNAVVAEKVSVTFPMYILGNDPVPHLVNLRNKNPRPSSWHEEPYGGVYAVDVPLTSGNQIFAGNLLGRDLYPNSGLVGVPGSVHTVSTTAKALFNLEANLSGGVAPTNPVNISGLRFMSMQLAADYWNWQAAEALDESYPGTYHWIPEGFHDILWSWYGSKRQATTRVMRAPWNAVIPEMQHGTPPMSGYHNQMAGIGGKTVAQAWQDSLSGYAVQTTLRAAMTATQTLMDLVSINNLPTEHRWKAKLSSGGPREEIVLCEGTSGFYNQPLTVVFRELDRSLAFAHPAGESVIWQFPDTVWNANLVTLGKMSHCFPQHATSGGIQGVEVVPQTQTVRIANAVGTLLGGVRHYSGEVYIYRPTDSTLINRETCWLVERNSLGVTANRYYDGQFAGFSRGITADGQGAAPVYLINQTAGGGDDFSFMRVLHPLPNKDGYYSGLLQEKMPDGKIQNTLPPQYRWLRDANNFVSLWDAEIYECTKTGAYQEGSDISRDVYTTKDFDLMVSVETRLSGTSTVEMAPLMKVTLDPTWCWQFTHVPETRETYVTRLLTVEKQEGTASEKVENVKRIVFKPKCSWEVTTPVDEGDVEIARPLDINEGDVKKSQYTISITFDSQDFKVDVGGTDCDALVETEGFTGTVGPFFKYECQGTQLIQRTWLGFPVRHGLIKDHIPGQYV